MKNNLKNDSNDLGNIHTYFSVNLQHSKVSVWTWLVSKYFLVVAASFCVQQQNKQNFCPNWEVYQAKINKANKKNTSDDKQIN